MGKIIVRFSDNRRAILFMTAVQKDYKDIEIYQNDNLIYISTESNTVNSVIHRAMALNLEILASIYSV